MKPLLLIFSFLILFNTQVAWAQNEVIIATEDITQDGFFEGEGFVPCNGPDCSTCHIVVLANTLVKWLIGIVFIFFAIIAVWAGFELVTSGGNPAALSSAKSKFTNAFIGLVIVLAAWLMVDTLLRGILAGGDGNIEGYGPWSNVQCVGQYDPETIILEEPPSYYADGDVPIDGNVTAGTIQTRIAAAASAYKGASTAAGPGGGNVACAWAVNNVLRNAGVAAVDGDSVREMERVLVGGRGARVDQARAVAGDLVILTGAKTRSNKTGNHVGICMNNGCTQVISNSSSRRSFSWISGPTFAPSYLGASPRFYRVTN